ncbi:MAG: hypothetical protein ACRDBX_04940, partial [Erysipelotrichaceae bacterium]
QILLESNNVSQSLLLSLEGAPSALQVPLASLCKQLEQNPADFTAYLSFLQEEQMHEIERLMKMLYRFQLVGAHDAAFQLHRMVETTAQWLTQERANRQKVRLSTYEWWGMLPLVMVTLVFMIMMFEVMVGMLGKGVGI